MLVSGGTGTTGLGVGHKISSGIGTDRRYVAMMLKEVNAVTSGVSGRVTMSTGGASSGSSVSTSLSTVSSLSGTGGSIKLSVWSRAIGVGGAGQPHHHMEAAEAQSV